MKKVLSVLWLATLVGGASLVWAQQDSGTTAVDNPVPAESSGPAVADTVGNTQESNIHAQENMDNQQINTDEGYGANDEEYNSSEGITNTMAPADKNAPAVSAVPAEGAENAGNTKAPAGQ